MKNRKILTNAMSLLLFFVLARGAEARVQDYTLDYSEENAPEVNEVFESPATDAPDPWTGFLSGLVQFAQVGWGIDLQGSAVLERNLDTPMMPASVLKMITTASALRNNLGSQAKYENYFDAQLDVATKGEPAAKVASKIKFTISGDPTWGHPSYESADSRLSLVIAALKSRGITQVNGPITIVSTRAGLNQIQRPATTSWPERWNLQCMATLPTSFMFNGNCGSIQVTAINAAKWTTPGVDVPIHLSLTAGSSNNLIIRGNFNSTGRIGSYSISGTFAHATSTFIDPLQISDENKTGSVGSFPVHEGDQWLRNLFILSLSQNGITYSENSYKKKGDSFSVDLSSNNLLNVLQVAVKNSINAILDRTFFETAIRLNSVNANDPSYAILHEVIGNDEVMKDIRLDDGSGLMIDDRLTSHSLFLFLQGLQSKSYFQDFISTLAVPGEPGTLSARLTGALTKGKIFAKTGTITGIANLAGYFQTPIGALQPFAILTSSNLDANPVRGMVDAIVTKFAALNSNTVGARKRKN